MYFMKSILFTLIFSLAGTIPQALLAGAPRRPSNNQQEKTEAPPQRSVVKGVASAGNAKTLVTALIVADLLDALRGDGPFTIFAPTDEAFAKLPPETLPTLLKQENRAKLASILKYHVVPGKFTAARLADSTELKTLEGSLVKATSDGHGLKVNGVNVIQADLICRNGVVHFIDRVLIPQADDILATAEKAGSFNTLLKAIKAAGLEDALRNGTFTVFAPTDEAFAKLGGEKIRALLKPANGHLLATILKYHVVTGRVTARDAVVAGRAKTLQGQEVRVGIKDGRLVINDSRVVATDIEARNGVIHVIDEVLIPGQND